MIDALVERRKLDKYAKKIHFRPLVEHVTFTLIREKKMTLRELQSMTKNRSARTFTGIEPASLSSLSDYINKLDTEALTELIETLAKRFRHLLTRKERKLFKTRYSTPRG